MAVKATATENHNDGAAHPRDEDQSSRLQLEAASCDTVDMNTRNRRNANSHEYENRRAPRRNNSGVEDEEASTNSANENLLAYRIAWLVTVLLLSCTATVITMVGQAVVAYYTNSIVYRWLLVLIILFSLGVLVLRVLLDFSGELHPTLVGRAAAYLIIQYIVAIVTAVFDVTSTGIGMWGHHNNNHTNITIN